jgi:hypothetical protein
LRTPAAFRGAQGWMRTLPTSYEDPLLRSFVADERSKCLCKQALASAAWKRSSPPIIEHLSGVGVEPTLTSKKFYPNISMASNSQ